MVLETSLINDVRALMRHPRICSGSPMELGDDVAASIRRNVGANLTRLLRKNGITQRKLANDLETDEAVVSRWANGRAFPEARQFDRIRELYGWKFEDLTRDPGSDSPVETLLRTLDEAGLTIVRKEVNKSE